MKMRLFLRNLLLASVTGLLAAACSAPHAGHDPSGASTGTNTPASFQAAANEQMAETPPDAEAPASAVPESVTPPPSIPEPAAPSPAASEPAASAPAAMEHRLKNKAAEIAEILRNRDLVRLKDLIDPETGLTFSPYPYIDTETALSFSPQDLPRFQDNTKRIWGAYDGSGEPMEMTFKEYFEKFVYDQDFASAPEVSVNSLNGTGNSPFNGLEIFPGASYVEFHFPGFEKQYEGMDWESLILVMIPRGQDWKLCAIVHASWTI
jgi:hypothetical protein